MKNENLYYNNEEVVYIEYQKGIPHRVITANKKRYMSNWDIIMKAIKQRYGDRFMEVNHQTNTCHKRFTVFFKTK
jgi:hypothetical protein